MVSHFVLLATFAALLQQFCLHVHRAEAAFATLTLQPVITTVTPSFGGAEGGTQIQIAGANFQGGTTGLSVTLLVFIGNEQCDIVEYHTSDNLITCITPKCYTTACLSSEDWQGVDYVQLSVYVETVETIYSATSTFTYSGAYTPQIIKMAHVAYGTQVGYIVGRTSTSVTSDLTITIDGQFADLGEESSLNPTYLSMWSTTSKVYYRTPTDVPAGFVNLTMTSQDDQSGGTEGTGLARMFPYRRPIDYAYDATYGRNFRVSPGGVGYSLAVVPHIAAVSPSVGSMAGGTLLTITGSGFSTNASAMTVFVGGRVCAIVSTTVDQVTCRTSPVSAILNPSLSDFSHTDDAYVVPSFTASTPRAYGSSGALIKFWNYFGGHVGQDSYATVFPWRQGFDLSLYNEFGYSWPSSSGLLGHTYFAADIITVLVAPYTGNYVFFINVDDVAYLYGAIINQKANQSAAEATLNAHSQETLLCYATYYQTYDVYFQSPTQQSQPVHLQRGQRYLLRARTDNRGGGNDQTLVAMRVTPDTVTVKKVTSKGKVINATINVDSLSATTTSSDGTPLQPVPALFSQSFLSLAALREVQQVSIALGHTYEVQTILLTGVTGGSYTIIIQDAVYTSPLSITASASTIANALNAAASHLPSSFAECYNFGVTTQRSGTTVRIQVTFQVDAPSPLSLLEVFDSSLQGTDINYNVSYTQYHSTMPSGYFTLSIPKYVGDDSVTSTTMVTSALIPYDCSASDMQDYLAAMATKFAITVEVSLSSSNQVAGSTWSITFLTPRGDIPPLHLNTTLLTADSVGGSVATVINGSTSTLWFDPIPNWCMEVPTALIPGDAEYSSIANANSNVEIYTKDPNTGDVLKSVCDAADESAAVTGFLGSVKGSEYDCVFEFSSDATPVMFEASVGEYLDNETASVTIIGRGFGMTNASKVKVTIAGHACNLTFISDDLIICSVAQVPHGQYYPVVSLSGIGYAYQNSTATLLTFYQDIFSVTHTTGSFAGGQELVITGRGFRADSNVTLRRIGVCRTTHVSSSLIICIVPAIPADIVDLGVAPPSSSPTGMPSGWPSAIPSWFPSSQPSGHPSSLPSGLPSALPTDPLVSFPIISMQLPTSASTAAPTEPPTALPTSEPSDRLAIVSMLFTLKDAEPSQLDANKQHRYTRPRANLEHLQTWQERSVLAVSMHMVSSIVPSQAPVVSPPTLEPVAQPSSTPSAVPSTAPVSEPTAQPTTDPSSEPSTTPSSSPTLAPTASPSPFPTVSPTPVPTVRPSSEPSAVPTRPTASPSTIPTVAPTTAPSAKPSLFPTPSPSSRPTAPTVKPTSRPVTDPTLAPTAFPSIKTFDNRNIFDILVDGRPTSHTFQYTWAATPLVQEVNPASISNAITTVMTIDGEGFGEALEDIRSVYVGDSECNVLNVSDVQVICRLPRNKTLEEELVHPVIVDVNGKGYAGYYKQVYTVPTVKRGFMVTGLGEMYGSVYGGNVIPIYGFGFLDADPEDYSVYFVQDREYSEYEQLLIALNLPGALSFNFSCDVISVQPDLINCTVPHSIGSSKLKEMPYSVVVVLNGVSSNCLNSSSNETKLCDYYPSALFTPQVNGISVLYTASTGAVVFSLSGTLLDKGTFTQVWVGVAECTVTDRSNISVTVSCDPLVAAQNAAVVVFVDTLGYANSSNIYLSSTLSVYGVLFGNDASTFAGDEWNVSTPLTAYTGSFGGGTRALVVGAGFAAASDPSSCAALNNVHIVVPTTGGHPVTFTEFISCAANVLVFQMPPIVAQGSSSAIASSLTTRAVSVLSVSVAGLTTNFTSFSFSYAAAKTPVATVSASSGYAWTTVTYTVTDPTSSLFSLSSISSVLSVAIGTTTTTQHPCHSQTISVSGNVATVNCVIPSLESTYYYISLNVYPLGNAMLYASSKYSWPSFHSLLAVTAFTDAVRTTSVFGGAELTLTGSGFGNHTKVTVCGVACNHLNATYNNLYCRTPKVLTSSGIQSIYDSEVSYDLIQPILVGSYYSASTMTSLKLANDTFYTTYVRDATLRQCWIGLKLPSGMVVQPYRVRFYPRLQYATYVQNVAFEGSLDGGNTWVNLGSQYRANEGWNFMQATNNSDGWYTNLRYRATDSTWRSYCMIAEIQFTGVLAFSNITCPVAVTSQDGSQHAQPGYFDYSDLSATPVLQSITPDNATALGGTEITLTGTLFNPLLPIHSGGSTPTVYFSGIRCNVVYYDSTTIKCVTDPRPPSAIVGMSIVVFIPGRGYALVSDDAQFLYIDKWSALTSWLNEEPPVRGDLVVIPDGQVILLDVKTPRIVALIIMGCLYLDDTKEVAINATYIHVDGGLLQAGTAARPHEGKVTITLHGDRFTTVAMPGFGSKVLAVSSKGVPGPGGGTTGIHLPSRYGGQLEIHGKKRLRTWTFLNQTAYAGQTYFVTSEPVDWAPGESLVMAGSRGNIASFNHPMFEIDEVVVSENVDGYTIIVEEPLLYTHTAEMYTIEGRVIDMRAEVGLLSRNIKIQGDDHSVSQLFGVHTIAFRSGIYRMENAEITKCGQAFAFGRYCTHSHMAKNMETSYTSANSIHHSFQRAVTTHMTNNWEMRDNVAYDITGHAYFVEDGAEQYNSFTGNLGILDRRSSALLLSDQKPSMYWAAVASNFYYDNIGVHSFHFGLWFEFDGQSSNDKISLCPAHEPIGAFRNNSFHYNANLGMRIYPEWTPLSVPCDDDSSPAPQYLYELLSFRNGGDGLFAKHHGDIHHIRPTLVENGGNGMDIVKYEHVTYTWNPNIVDGLFVGSVDPNRVGGGLALFNPQREFWYVVNTTFVNHNQAMSSCSGCLDPESLWQGADTYRFSGLKFVNTTRRIMWSPTYKDIWWDLDGTLTGTADTMITPFYEYNEWPECHVPDSAVWDVSLRCDPGVRIRRLGIDNVYPNQLSYTDITMVTEMGVTGNLYFLPLEIYGWVVPVVNNHTYFFEYADAGISAYQYRLTYGRDEYLLEQIAWGKNETVEIDYTHNKWDYNPYSFLVTYGSHSYLSSNKSSVRMNHISDTLYVNGSTERLIMSTVGYDHKTAYPFVVSVNAQNCPPSGCWEPPAPTLSDPMLWSKKSTWPTKIVPVKGQAVTIESNMWVVLDISPPKLGCINVYGKLSFVQRNDANITLMALCIVVYGTFEIVGPNNTAYDGTANVVIYGGQGASLPVNLGNNIYPGSKVIAVAGEFNVIGREVVNTWVQLNSTAYAGSNSITVNGNVDWNVGDIISVSPTGYYTSSGSLWSDVSSGNGAIESRSIISLVHNYQHNTTSMILNQTLLHDHLCTVSYGEVFCGKVGYLSRSINFISNDAENPKNPSYGFGAHIHVTDLNAGVNGISRSIYGSVNLYNVAFWRFGKQNSDHQAVTFAYSRTSHVASSVVNCAFINTYNFAIYGTYTDSLFLAGNVVIESWGGAIFLDATNSNFEVLSNMVVGTHQLLSILKSAYPWQRPVASFVVLSGSGTVAGNFAAGSVDGGFNLAQGLFINRVSDSACSNTRGEDYSFAGTDVSVLHSYKSVWDNEAVGCRSGLALVTVSRTESTATDCAVMIGFKLWRNGHHGIISMDTVANVLVVDTIVAENHIGISINFRKDSTDAFSGVYNSKIIGGLSTWSPKYTNISYCPDLSDSNWEHTCQAFTQTDPLGLSMSSCGSTLAGTQMMRVGILLPQFLNGRKTCALGGTFPRCEPPDTVERLCALPYETRYGVPTSMQSGEQHIHHTMFGGFTTQGYCSSYAYSQRSFAIATNPQMIDEQPPIIVSGALWKSHGGDVPVGTVLDSYTLAGKALPNDMDSTAKFGFDVYDADYASICVDHPCTGYNMLLVFDVDGTVVSEATSNGGGGQILFDNPEYAAPYPQCVTASELGLGFIYCPNITETGDEPFVQYHALWRDSGPQVLQPLVVTRYFEEEGENRSFASFGPIMEPCSKIGFYSRYPTMLAKGVVNRVRTTGTIPSTWLIRWDAPSENDATIIQIFIEPSDAINVFIGSSEGGTFTLVNRFDHDPTLDDPAGSNSRNPTHRTLTVVLRGGQNNFYKFVDIPFVQVTMKMEMSMSDFYAANFIANLAMLLRITPDRIAIASVRSGSVIVNFKITPANTVASTTDELSAQVIELQQVTANFSAAIVAGTVESALNVTISQIIALEPSLPVVIDETYVPASNSTQNITQFRAAQLAQSQSVSHFLFTYPTSRPTGQPSMQPSAQPSGKPTMRPSCQPSGRPTSKPTGQPSSPPTGQPSSAPSTHPSAQPSVYPTSQPSSCPSSQPSGLPSAQPSSQPTNPTSQPTGEPTSQPSSQPSNQPTQQPTRQPTSQPSRQPTSQPSRQPTRQPTSQPTRQPTSQPSEHPSRQPTSRPSSRPSIQPTMHPSTQPTSHPSSQPTTQPTSQPTVWPSSRPSSQPSSQPSDSPSSVPSSQPTPQPSVQPSGKPSSVPSRHPTAQPTIQPSEIPSSQPSSIPSVQPTAKPTAQPSGQPSVSPSSKPTSLPSRQPSAIPTGLPSAVPTAKPSGKPTSDPSSGPTSLPSGLPSSEPSVSPSGIPSMQPTSQPSRQPSGQPSSVPTSEPSSAPTCKPTADPSVQPSAEPTSIPSSLPSSLPTSVPTSNPSAAPTSMPSTLPTGLPSSQPTSRPSAQPSSTPTAQPSSVPSSCPSVEPTSWPTSLPSAMPSPCPTSRPSCEPSGMPSIEPTTQPSCQPSSSPSTYPTSSPTSRPSSTPSSRPSSNPSAWPTGGPTSRPSGQPSGNPTTVPSSEPSVAPSSRPTSTPSATPTAEPSSKPTSTPSSNPTGQPSLVPSSIPTRLPSSQPSSKPSRYPSAAPTGSPTSRPTSLPSSMPSSNPTGQPSLMPSSIPTRSPTSQPSSKPSRYPSSAPTGSPTSRPTTLPSSMPSSDPTVIPTTEPTAHPSSEPSSLPTVAPSSGPSSVPSSNPTSFPTGQPTGSPSATPSESPTSLPTSSPSSNPSAIPSNAPSAEPSSSPSSEPSGQPIARPTTVPSAKPTVCPSADPTGTPTSQPSGQPSTMPSCTPSSLPSALPSGIPTGKPSTTPTDAPTGLPSSQPSTSPTTQPSSAPSGHPTGKPSAHPSSQPSGIPTDKPTNVPSDKPSSQPSSKPTDRPTILPSSKPSGEPTSQPSSIPSSRPTSVPMHDPTGSPTVKPSSQPTSQPLAQPSSHPTGQPVPSPSSRPSTHPSHTPRSDPTSRPSNHPSSRPSAVPTSLPSSVPSSFPTKSVRTQVSFTSTLSLAGLTVSQAWEGESALESSLVSTMGDGMGIQVTVDSITSSSATSKAANYVDRMLLEHTPLQEHFDVDTTSSQSTDTLSIGFSTYFYLDRVSGGVDSAFSQLSGRLSDAVTGGTFGATLAAANSQLFGNITVLSISSDDPVTKVVSNFPPTSQPTPVATEKANSVLSVDQWFTKYFYIPILGLVGLAFFAFAVYRNMLAARSKKEYESRSRRPSTAEQDPQWRVKPTDLQTALNEDPVLMEEKRKFKEGLKAMITDLYTADTEDAALGEKLVNIINTSDLLTPEDIKELVEFARVKSLRDLVVVSSEEDSDGTLAPGKPLPTLRRLVSLHALRGHLGVKLTTSGAMELHDIDEGEEGGQSTPNKLEQGSGRDSIHWEDLYRYESNRDVRSLGSNDMRAGNSSRSGSRDHDETKRDSEGNIVMGAFTPRDHSSPPTTRPSSRPGSATMSGAGSRRYPQPDSAPPVAMTSPAASFKRPKQIQTEPIVIRTTLSSKHQFNMDELFENDSNDAATGINPLSRSMDERVSTRQQHVEASDWRKGRSGKLMSASVDAADGPMSELVNRKHSPRNKIHREYKFQQVEASSFATAGSGKDAEFVMAPPQSGLPARVRAAANDVQRHFAARMPPAEYENAINASSNEDDVGTGNTESFGEAEHGSSGREMSTKARLEEKVRAHQSRKESKKMTKKKQKQQQRQQLGIVEEEQSKAKTSSSRPKTSQAHSNAARNRRYNNSAETGGDSGWTAAGAGAGSSKSPDSMYATGHSILMPASIDTATDDQYTYHSYDVSDDDLLLGDSGSNDQDSEEDIEYEDYYGERWETSEYVHGNTRRILLESHLDDDEYDKPLQLAMQKQLSRLDSAGSMESDLDSIKGAGRRSGSVVVGGLVVDDEIDGGEAEGVLVRRARIARQREHSMRSINVDDDSSVQSATKQTPPTQQQSLSPQKPPAFVRHPTARIEIPATYNPNTNTHYNSNNPMMTGSGRSPSFSSRQQQPRLSNADNLNTGNTSNRSPAREGPDGAHMQAQSSFTRKATVKLGEIYEAETGTALAGNNNNNTSNFNPTRVPTNTATAANSKRRQQQQWSSDAL